MLQHRCIYVFYVWRNPKIMITPFVLWCFLHCTQTFRNEWSSDVQQNYNSHLAWLSPWKGMHVMLCIFNSEQWAGIMSQHNDGLSCKRCRLMHQANKPITLVTFRPKMCFVRIRKRHVTLSKWHKLRLLGQSYEHCSSWYSSKSKVCHLFKSSRTLTCCLMPKVPLNIWMRHQSSFGEHLLHSCYPQYMEVISMMFS